MKLRTLLFIALFILGLFMPSCFEIRERIELNRDGSGTFSLIIDFTNVRAMLDGLAGDGDSGEDPFSGMQQQFEATRGLLAGVNGISNILFTSEQEGYLITASFDFSGIEALNRGMDAVYENESGLSEYYTFDKKSFERTDAHNFIDAVREELGGDGMSVEGMDLGAIFSDVSYVNEVVFRDARVKKVRSGFAEVSEDGTTVTNRYYIFRNQEDQSLEFRLKLK